MINMDVLISLWHLDFIPLCIPGNHFFLDPMVVPFLSLLKFIHNYLYNSWMNSHFPNSAISAILNGDYFTD